MRTYRLIWLSVAVPVTAVGLTSGLLAFRGAVVPLAMLGAVLGCAAGLAAHGGASPQGNGPTRHDLVGAGALGALATVVAAGFGWLLGAATLALLLILAALSPWLLSRWATRLSPHLQISAQPTLLTSEPDTTERSGSVDPDAVHARGELGSRRHAASDPSSLNDAELQWAWRTSFTRVEMTQDPSERARLADLRAAYLDELERRDPAGFARWLDKGARAASDPGRYIRRRSEGSGPVSA